MQQADLYRLHMISEASLLKLSKSKSVGGVESDHLELIISLLDRSTFQEPVHYSWFEPTGPESAKGISRPVNDRVKDIKEFDEIDNDTLTIFESWATETFVRKEDEGDYLDDQNLILRTVIRDDYKLEDLILSQHTLAENVRKGWF